MSRVGGTFLAGLLIFVAIEIADYYVDAFSSPWWLSLLMAFCLSVVDIILIYCHGEVFDD